MEQRTLCVQGGGEIPCHFSTLTTTIYHWSDLAQCLEKYEAATMKRRGGRMDPLEPSERQLSAERRRVLRYPGVVAWFTAYKMELFYKHVLRYEDGQGVFEWGSGGIMHLHSINFGPCMPRVDPAAAGMQQPDVRTADVAARFAEMHEEYLTDWSLAKAEKWTFHEVDNSTARLARPGSPHGFRIRRIRRLGSYRYFREMCSSSDTGHRLRCWRLHRCFRPACCCRRRGFPACVSYGR